MKKLFGKRKKLPKRLLLRRPAERPGVRVPEMRIDVRNEEGWFHQ